MGEVGWRIGVLDESLSKLVESAETVAGFVASAGELGWVSEKTPKLHEPFFLKRRFNSGYGVALVFSNRALRLRYLEALAEVANANGASAAVVVIFSKAWRSERPLRKRV